MLDITAISKTFHPGTPNARQALRQLSCIWRTGSSPPS